MTSLPRRRPAVLVVLLLVVGLALLSRRYPLPGLLAEHTGDALYATAAYCLFALCLPRGRTGALATGAFAFSAAIELSQLLTWPWLGEIRATRLGALLLGQGFQVTDLFAYLAGVGLAWLVDVTFLRRSTGPPPDLDRLPHQSRSPR